MAMLFIFISTYKRIYYLYTYVATYILYLGNGNTQLDNISTYINLTTLRRECGGLDELLISAKNIEFKEVLGEGIFKLCIIEKSPRLKIVFFFRFSPLKCLLN